MGDAEILTAIYEKVGEIRGDVKGLKERAEAQDSRYELLENRVRSLEGGANWMAGASAIIGGIVGAIVAYFSKILHGV